MAFFRSPMSVRTFKLILLFSAAFTFVLLLRFNWKTEVRLKKTERPWAYNFPASLKCDPLFHENPPKEDVQRLMEWKYDETMFADQLWQAGGDCNALKKTFGFNDQPLSQEEAEFSLAYGSIVYKNLAQFYFMMGAIFHPQNAYCIAVDRKSKPEFKTGVRRLAECFPNITVIEEGPIKWCEKTILQALYNCFLNLTLQKHAWRYFQYITGFDLPLKTNLEMVRIFKQLNGTVVAEVTTNARLRNKKRIDNSTRLAVWKASMSALVSREAADAALKNESNRRVVEEVLDHIYVSSSSIYKTCPDELFWTTVFGNSHIMSLPGSYDAEGIIREKLVPKFFGSLQGRNLSALRRPPEDPFVLQHYNVGRYQVWGSKKATCHGKYKAGSCVYGLHDLPVLIQRAELTAHKFHMDVQPAAFFCLWLKVKQRADDPEQQRFVGHNYRQLPHVRMHHGTSIQELSDEYTRQTNE